MSTETVYFGMGCFWGAEKKMWQIPGVVATEVGYQGGHSNNPTYREVCSGTTGHAEIVKVEYDTAVVSLWQLLGVFWENHDPTQGNRQGNDIGTQYRSAVYWTSEAQERDIQLSAQLYQGLLDQAGYGKITTEFAAADDKPFWSAEESHQKYLKKNPFGYDCHASSGIALPARPAE
jgi:methionine-S-sulfoxide reductase